MNYSDSGSSDGSEEFFVCPIRRSDNPHPEDRNAQREIHLRRLGRLESEQARARQESPERQERDRTAEEPSQQSSNGVGDTGTNVTTLSAAPARRNSNVSANSGSTILEEFALPHTRTGSPSTLPPTRVGSPDNENRSLPSTRRGSAESFQTVWSDPGDDDRPDGRAGRTSNAPPGHGQSTSSSVGDGGAGGKKGQ
jgi:hypothetical protein